MPAPSGSAIKGLIYARLPARYQNVQHFDFYLTALSAEASSSWKKWIDAGKWGGCTVVGAGVGGWAGVGAGGKFTAVGKFQMNPTKVIDDAGWSSQEKFRADMAKSQIKFILNLSKVLDDKLSTWSKSVVFAGLGYSGTSTATPLSPGTFNARNVPTPLVACGVVPPISGVVSALHSKLVSSEDGDPFNIDHQHARVKEFTSAVGGAIEAAFVQIFLTTTKAAQNSVQGVAAPGGVGSARSGSDGKLL